MYSLTPVSFRRAVPLSPFICNLRQCGLNMKTFVFRSHKVSSFMPQMRSPVANYPPLSPSPCLCSVYCCVIVSMFSVMFTTASSPLLCLVGSYLPYTSLYIGRFLVFFCLSDVKLFYLQSVLKCIS
jgi:hypothetical protein